MPNVKPKISGKIQILMMIKLKMTTLKVICINCHRNWQTLQKFTPRVSLLHDLRKMCPKFPSHSTNCSFSGADEPEPIVAFTLMLAPASSTSLGTDFPSSFDFQLEKVKSVGTFISGGRNDTIVQK